ILGTADFDEEDICQYELYRCDDEPNAQYIFQVVEQRIIENRGHRFIGKQRNKVIKANKGLLPDSRPFKKTVIHG
ncbi:MAG: hypothetical protein WAW98_07985, partial [Trichococcus flocculiformis]